MQVLEAIDQLSAAVLMSILISFYLSYDKPCGKLALGQNCVIIISDNSNSVAMF